MFLDKIILLSAVVASVYADFTKMDESRAVEITNCCGNILCYGDPDEFLKVEQVANHEKAIDDAYNSLSTIYDVEYTKDGFFSALKQKLCNEMTYHERTQKFSGFGVHISNEYEANNCKEDSDTPICQAYINGMAEMENVMAAAEAEGICCDKKNPSSPRCQEDAKNVKSIQKKGFMM